MTNHTTANGTTYVHTTSGYQLTCRKCAGTGIYWRRVQTASGYTTIPDTCYRCLGNCAEPNSKSIATTDECERHSIQLRKASDRREAKRQTDEEARRAELLSRVVEPEPIETVTYKTLDANVGDIVTITGNVNVTIEIETDYGFSRLIIIETADNELVKMFTTAKFAWDIERDQTVTVTGTVKAFGEYDGKPQTQIIRPKLAN